MASKIRIGLFVMTQRDYKLIDQLVASVERNARVTAHPSNVHPANRTVLRDGRMDCGDCGDTVGYVNLSARS